MKLTKKKVEKIKQAITDGVTQPDIAKRFKVSRSIVSDIATGRDHRPGVGTPAEGGPAVCGCGQERGRAS